MISKMTVSDVVDRLEQAAHTLRRQPSVRVKGYQSFWPDIVYSPAEAYGWEVARHVRSIPTGKEIDQMDEALTWINFLDDSYEAKLVWARACRVKWKILEYKFGFSRRKLFTDWQRAIIKITLFLQLPRSSDSYRYKKRLTMGTQKRCAHVSQIQVQKSIS